MRMCVCIVCMYCVYAFIWVYMRVCLNMGGCVCIFMCVCGRSETRKGRGKGRGADLKRRGWDRGGIVSEREDPRPFWDTGS